MSNELARVQRTEIGRSGVAELVEVASQANQIKDLGQTLIASGLLPDAIKKPESAVAVMIKGAEIGLGAMYALSHIAIISGKPAMSAEAMTALVQRAGHAIRIVETSSERCIVEGVRREDPKHPTRITWTMDDAKTAKLAGKGPWQAYPRAMLRSRAISELCRAMFAAELAGISYVPEELGAVVDGDGQIVETPRQVHTDSTDSTDGNSEVEEADVVEDEPSHEDVLDWIDDHLQKAPDNYFGGEPLKMREYASRDLQHAIRAQQKMLKILDEGGVAEASGQGTSDGAPRKELPATRKQLTYLKSLILDTIEDGGMEKFEEMIGKEFADLTREEASEWVGRLSGSAA